MSRDVLEHLIWSLEQSFRNKKEHSLIANLSSVTTDDLDTIVRGGGRTMRDLIIHCGAVKLMHANHAFEDATHTFWTTWDRQEPVSEASFEELLEWLEETHDTVIDSVQHLNDDHELVVLRPTYWGASWETRRILDAIAVHDVYHAGEINHLRALIHQVA